jgi:hypothetical protein
MYDLPHRTGGAAGCRRSVEALRPSRGGKEKLRMEKNLLAATKRAKSARSSCAGGAATARGGRADMRRCKAPAAPLVLTHQHQRTHPHGKTLVMMHHLTWRG